MDAGWGVETTRRLPLAIAFVAGNLTESGLMAIGAVPRNLAPSVVLTPLILSAAMLPMARLAGGADVFAGTIVVVLGINAVVYAGAFAKGTALAVDELVLASQTLAAWCALATLALPDVWSFFGLLGAFASHFFTIAALTVATVWSLVYVTYRPRPPRWAAFLTIEGVALCVVGCCWAALRGSDFTCLWPGDPLPETLLHSFAAGMALFYLMFHAALFLIPTYGRLFTNSAAQDAYLSDFDRDLENKLILRGAPLWLVSGCLALQAATWALIYTKRLLAPPAVMLFVALGFAHVFLIELKRHASARAALTPERQAVIT